MDCDAGSDSDFEKADDLWTVVISSGVTDSNRLFTFDMIRHVRAHYILVA